MDPNTTLYNITAQQLANETGCTGITNYEKTTLANIPVLTNDFCTIADIVGEDDLCARLQLRMCAIVFCSWAIVWYTLRNIRREWGEILEMRRKHYFEADIAGEEKQEETLLVPHNAQEIHDIAAFQRRDPWIPHPEQRETTSSIDLYSVLVQGIPSDPSEAVQDVDAVLGVSRQNKIDWQMAVTAEFFDRCVPNQPGFSSSVVAVTILPSADELAMTWKKWQPVAAALRRLKFIRAEIVSRRDGDDPTNSAASVLPPAPNHRADLSPSREGSRSIHFDNYRELLGTCTDLEIESHVMEALNLGPEQSAMYDREFAQSASGCCPNGRNEKQVRRASLEELQDMEQDAIAEVQETHAALRQSQKEARAKLTEDVEAQSAHSLAASDNYGERDVLNSEFLSLRTSDHAQRDKSSAAWKVPSIRKWLAAKATELKMWANARHTGFVHELVRESSYVIVTFTSRQAAVAARQCLADGRGDDQWIALENLPVPPLADGPVCSGGRFCCRPVTVNIPDRQKYMRWQA